MKETLKLALEALEYHTEQTRPIHQTSEAITAIKEALAQPAQEPVATFDEVWDSIDWDKWRMEPIRKLVKMIHSKTTPPQRPWVDLTESEWFDWWRVSQVADATEIDFADFLIIAQAVTAKLKERNA